MFPIYKIFPYLYLTGISITVIAGLITYYTYEPYTLYSKDLLYYFSMGVGLTFISAYFVWLNGTRSIEESDGTEVKKDKRVWINKAWDNRMKLANLFVAVAIIGILSPAGHFFDITLLVSGIIWAFIFIMRDNEEDDESDIEKRSHRVKVFLKLVDYRKHPFHLPFILFLLIVLSFFLANQQEMMLNHLDVGDSFRGWSFPLAMITLAAAVFASSFIFIIHNSDIFGIRQQRQNELKIIALHFADLGISGLAFFIWITTLVTAM